MTEKYCPRCCETLSIDKFTTSSSRRDGYQAYCSECMKAYRREHYQSNKKQYYDRARKTKQRIREIIWAAKDVPCIACGDRYPNEPWLMEFDHIDPNQKVLNIAALANLGSVRRIEEEIAKCEVKCLVCHRRRTAEMLGWTSKENYDIMVELSQKV